MDVIQGAIHNRLGYIVEDHCDAGLGRHLPNTATHLAGTDNAERTNLFHNYAGSRFRRSRSVMRAITWSIKYPGVEAPAVTPISFTPANHSASTSVGSSMCRSSRLPV